MCFPDDEGGVAHAELRLGDGAIVVFSDRDGYQRPPRRGDTMGIGMYICLAEPAEVDAIHGKRYSAAGKDLDPADRGDERLHQPGLADPRVTLDHDEPALPQPDVGQRRIGGQLRIEHGQLRGAADQVRAGDSPTHPASIAEQPSVTLRLASPITYRKTFSSR